MIRPRILYTGELDKKFVEIDKREIIKEQITQ